VYFPLVDVAIATKRFTRDTLPPTTTSTSIPESRATSLKMNRTFQFTTLTALKVAEVQATPTQAVQSLTITETALETVTASIIATATRRETTTMKKISSNMAWSPSIACWIRSRDVPILI